MGCYPHGYGPQQLNDTFLVPSLCMSIIIYVVNETCHTLRILLRVALHKGLLSVTVINVIHYYVEII